MYVIKQEVSTDYWAIQNYRDLQFRVFRKRGHGYNGDGNNFTRDFTSNDIKNNLNKLPDEEFLQIYSQDGYFARNCERFIFDDYKLACRAAEILNNAETEIIREKELGRPFSCVSSKPKYNADYLEKVIKTKWLKKLEELESENAYKNGRQRIA